MKIHNVRLGHATNSSSSHSLVFLSEPAWDSDADGEFGWGFFTLASKEAKSRYLAVALAGALRDQTTDAIAAAVVQSWLPNSNWSPADYIDHQSFPSFPRDWSGKGVDKEFFDAYKDYVLRDGVVILGGNDNTEEGHPLSGGQSLAVIPEEADTTHMVVRKDGDHWTIFDRRSGSKVRLSLADKASPLKAVAPELVDVKLTDFCPFGCSYCYQNSTLKGRHAETSDLYALAQRFGKMKVFEVAIGGGEPTLHPNFVETLEAFRNAGVVPNFTTRNLSWLADPVESRRILGVTGAFAVSVDKGEQVHKLATLLKAGGHEDVLSGRKVHVQYVVGSGDLHGVLRAALEERITLTLLGYKLDGRGKHFDPSAYEREHWLRITADVHKEAQKKGQYLQVGVDTALIVQAGQAKLEKAGIHESLYTKREGAFSMYVDAVAKTMAPASYGCEGKDQPLVEYNHYSDEPDPILATFAGF